MIPYPYIVASSKEEFVGFLFSIKLVEDLHGSQMYYGALQYLKCTWNCLGILTIVVSSMKCSRLQTPKILFHIYNPFPNYLWIDLQFHQNSQNWRPIALFSSQEKKNIWKICCMHKNHETRCKNVLLCVFMCLILNFFLPSWRQQGSLDPHLLCQFIVGVQNPSYTHQATRITI